MDGVSHRRKRVHNKQSLQRNFLSALLQCKSWATWQTSTDFFSGFFVFHISIEAGRWTPKIRLGSDFQLVRCHMSHPDVSVDLTVTKQLSFGSINLFMSTFSPYCLRIRYQHLMKSNVCTIYIFSLCDVMCTVAFLTFFLFTSFCRAWFHQELILQHEFNWAFQ